MRYFKLIVKHSVFLIFCMMAGFIAVFKVGIPAIGDNPGALFGGFFVFFATYPVMIGAEIFLPKIILSFRKNTAIETRKLTKTIINGLLKVFFSAVSLYIAFSIALFAGLPKSSFAPVAILILLTLALEVLFYSSIDFIIEKISKKVVIQF